MGRRRPRNLELPAFEYRVAGCGCSGGGAGPGDGSDGSGEDDYENVPAGRESGEADGGSGVDGG